MKSKEERIPPDEVASVLKLKNQYEQKLKEMTSNYMRFKRKSRKTFSYTDLLCYTVESSNNKTIMLASLKRILEICPEIIKLLINRRISVSPNALGFVISRELKASFNRMNKSYNIGLTETDLMKLAFTFLLDDEPLAFEWVSSTFFSPYRTAEKADSFVKNILQELKTRYFNFWIREHYFKKKIICDLFLAFYPFLDYDEFNCILDTLNTRKIKLDSFMKIMKDIPTDRYDNALFDKIKAKQLLVTLKKA